MYLVYIALSLATIALAICIYLLINQKHQFISLNNSLGLVSRRLVDLRPPIRGLPEPETESEPEPVPEPEPEPESDLADQASLVSLKLTPETLSEFNLE